MVGEIFAGVGAFKAMFDMAKGLKDLNDAATRNAVAIELQEKILTARAAQSDLAERVRELEAQVASFKTWETEKQRYELKGLGYGSFAYMLKPDARGSAPPHLVCANCYEHGQKPILQYITIGKGGQGYGWVCPSCHNAITPGIDTVEWRD